jgi:hypothetical protein
MQEADTKQTQQGAEISYTTSQDLAHGKLTQQERDLRAVFNPYQRPQQKRKISLQDYQLRLMARDAEQIKDAEAEAARDFELQALDVNARSHSRKADGSDLPSPSTQSKRKSSSSRRRKPQAKRVCSRLAEADKWLVKY